MPIIVNCLFRGNELDIKKSRTSRGLKHYPTHRIVFFFSEFRDDIDDNTYNTDSAASMGTDACVTTVLAFMARLYPCISPQTCAFSGM